MKKYAVPRVFSQVIIIVSDNAAFRTIIQTGSSVVADNEVCVKATTIKCDQESAVPCASWAELHDHFLSHILVLGWTTPPGCHQTLIHPKSLLSPSSSSWQFSPAVCPTTCLHRGTVGSAPHTPSAQFLSFKVLPADGDDPDLQLLGRHLDPDSWSSEWQYPSNLPPSLYSLPI